MTMNPLALIDRFNFSPKQIEACFKSLTLGKKINIRHGAIQSSKTDESIVTFAIRCIANPGAYVAVGRTLATLKRNVFNGDRKLNDHFRGLIDVGQNQARIGDSTIYLIGADNKNAETKIRGGHFKGGYGDEVTLLPRDLIRHMIGRCDVLDWTCNPDSPYHFVNQEFLLNNKDVFSIHFVLDDNPSKTQAEKDYLKRQYTGLWYKRFIDGLWVMAEGIIYQSFKDQHVYKSKIKKDYDYIIVGIDYGTTNPACFLIIYVKDGAYYVQDEYYWDSVKQRRQKGDDEYFVDFEKFISENIVPPTPAISPEDFYKTIKIYSDESAASFNYQLRRARPGRVGYKVYLADTHDPANRCRYIDSLYAQNKIFIHESCISVRMQNTTYIWDENLQKKGKDYPLKENDHAMNAKEYGICGDRRAGGGKQIR